MKSKITKQVINENEEEQEDDNSQNDEEDGNSVSR